MSLIPLLSAVLVFILVPIPCESYFLRRLIFGTPKTPSIVAMFARTIGEPAKSGAQFADFMSQVKKLEPGSKYEVAKIYRNELIDNSFTGLMVVSFDVLLRRHLTSRSKAYPFVYLHCKNVEIEQLTKVGTFQVKKYDCTDIEVQGELEKDIVAQAAREYAREIVGDKYYVFHVPKVEIRKSNSQRKDIFNVTLFMQVEMIRLKGLEKRKHLEILDCSNVVLKYGGNPGQFKASHVAVINSGKCVKTIIPTVNKRQDLSDENYEEI